MFASTILLSLNKNQKLFLSTETRLVISLLYQFHYSFLSVFRLRSTFVSCECNASTCLSFLTCRLTFFYGSASATRVSRVKRHVHDVREQGCRILRKQLVILRLVSRWNGTTIQQIALADLTVDLSRERWVNATLRIADVRTSNMKETLRTIATLIREFWKAEGLADFLRHPPWSPPEPRGTARDILLVWDTDAYMAKRLQRDPRTTLNTRVYACETGRWRTVSAIFWGIHIRTTP